MSQAGQNHVFIVAAEESGDRLAAGLIHALRGRFGSAVAFEGVGGAAMAEAGVPSLFPVDDLSIIGFMAIPGRLRLILRRIRETAEAIIAAKPDVLVIVDSPDFTHRVARRVRRAMPDLPIVNYVAPTVWAWRPGRARAMRAYVTHVMAVLPFEPQALAKLGGPPTTYVGHPLIDELATLRPTHAGGVDNPDRRPRLVVLPGSRRAEIERLMDVFGETVSAIAADLGPLDVVLPTLPRLEALVREKAAHWRVPPRIVTGEDEKRAAFRTARAALVKSGTVTLELALAGVPMVAAYKVSAIEAFVARRALTVPSVILANLVLGENAVPEFLQDDCSAERMAPVLAELMKDGPARDAQHVAFARLDCIMGVGGASPSVRAAEVVANYLRLPISM